MEPKKVGRVLGIGVRVASKMVRERVEQASAPSPVPISRPITAPKAEKTMETAKRGAKAFGQALMGPFTHAGSILWLEITGLFFALFALFFVQNIYRVRSAFHDFGTGGPERSHLMLYVALAIGFAWFSVSSFLRARGKSRRGPG